MEKNSTSGGPGQSHHYRKASVIVGYGPIGRQIARTAVQNGYSPIIIESNIDTVRDLEEPHPIIFGNAVEETILTEAHIAEAKHSSSPCLILKRL